MPKTETYFKWPRVTRYNWGREDGHAASIRGRLPEWGTKVGSPGRHFDPDCYARGFWRGWREAQAAAYGGA